MTETRQTALFSLSILTLIAALGALAVGFKTLDQCRTDNQTIAALRAQMSDLKKDLHDTEVALDEGAKERERLSEESEIWRARAERAERRARL